MEKITRRQFLKRSALLTVGAGLGVFIGKELGEATRELIFPSTINEEERKELWSYVNDEAEEIRKAVNKIGELTAKECGVYFSSTKPDIDDTILTAKVCLDLLEFPGNPLTDIISTENLVLWIKGELEPPKGNPPPIEILEGVEDGERLRQTVRWLLDNFIKKDQGRIKKVVCSDKNSSNILGEMFWQVGASVDYFFHELAHTTVPQPRFLNKEGKFFLYPTNGSFPQIVNFDRLWLTTIADNFPFFKTRFFDAPGDETLDLIAKHGSRGVLDAKNEFIAMLCADYVRGTREAEIIDNGRRLKRITDGWPTEVEQAVDITWNWIMYGQGAELKPIDPTVWQNTCVDLNLFLL